jgi:hypothetical protein
MKRLQVFTLLAYLNRSTYERSGPVMVNREV